MLQTKVIAMPNTPRPVRFRAVHSKNRWRRSNHETERHALEGTSSTYPRSARALFEGRNPDIDYQREGEPRFVIVSDPAKTGDTIAKPDSSMPDGLRRAVLPRVDFEKFEMAGGPPSDAELERYFFRHLQVIDSSGIGTGEQADADFQTRLEASMRRSAEDRRRRLQSADPVPQRIEIRTFAFVRNTDVIVEVLERASGRCEGCLEAAPFIRGSDGSPYLEVHHRVHLADGGADTVENAVALCPNCHRQRHFGRR